jgi:hypothetical protein
MMLGVQVFLWLFRSEPAIHQSDRRQESQKRNEDPSRDRTVGIVREPPMILKHQDASVDQPQPIERENGSEREKPEANAKFHLIKYDVRDFLAGQGVESSGQTALYCCLLGNYPNLQLGCTNGMATFGSP